MATIVERLDAQTTALLAERARIVGQAERDLAAVDQKLGALRDARPAFTKTVEDAFAALKSAGVIKEA